MPAIRNLLKATAMVLIFMTTASALPTIHPKRSSQTPELVLNGLPSPDGLTLKYIALGYGTQNYTCSNTTASPVAVGAIAVLYDATSLLTNEPSSVPTLPALAYSTSSSLGLATLGHHYFSASSTPTFDLDAANPRAFLSAKKMDSVNAPSSSIPNSVAWLYLADNGTGLSQNLKAVYRVETAGGGAPSACTKAGNVEVEYAAEYWFYD